MLYSNENMINDPLVVNEIRKFALDIDHMPHKCYLNQEDYDKEEFHDPRTIYVIKYPKLKIYVGNKLLSNRLKENQVFMIINNLHEYVIYRFINDISVELEKWDNVNDAINALKRYTELNRLNKVDNQLEFNY